MPSPDDGDSVQQPPPLASIPRLHVSKTRSPTRDESPETSTTSLPIRTSSPPFSTRASTLVNAFTRAESPSGSRSLSLSRLGRPSTASTLINTSESDNDTRTLIVRAFSPTVAVYASEDTDDLARQKGLKHGFVHLVRPYGERVTGKVVVRDSVGASRAWDDFGVHFVDLGQVVQGAVNSAANQLDSLEELMEQRVEQNAEVDDEASSIHDKSASNISPYYRLFLSRLLCSGQLSPHEAFQHPTACVIAISSHTPNPIETLRQLYAQTAHGNRTLLPYANPEYLRYYVLIHDEDHSDITKTSALFDQMKRHFGLHCHLLRLRSVATSPTDDDAVPLPSCEWQTPAEDLDNLTDATQLLDLGDTGTPHIFDSDAQALRAFVRELVAQSVVPHMENRIALWNEQIASRRRGISGRIATFSKRWAGFGGGSSSRNASSTNLSTPGSSGQSGNYDAVQGTYRYDTSEAQLRKMADYAVMLRDYKLASSTYELLRTDFGNDKAWKYLAGANEMGVICALLNPLQSASVGGKGGVKVSEFEPMLETLAYSYLTRCQDRVAAVRAVVVAVELLRVRGRAAAEMASRWAVRCLEWNVLGSVGRVLIEERVVGSLSVVGNLIGDGKSWGWGRRRRKAALWSVVVAEEWMKLGQVEVAARRLEDAEHFYEEVYSEQPGSKDREPQNEGWIDFREMRDFVQTLQTTVRIKRGQARRRGKSEAEQMQIAEAEAREEENQRGRAQPEQLEQLDTRLHRRSMHGGPGSVIVAHPLEVQAPLSPVRMNRPDPLLASPGQRQMQRRDEDDDFE